MSSKLMIKATLGSDIRRVSIHNEELTYDELILMLQRVFRGKLSNEDEILLKYKDEDDDLITIFDSADLAFALELCPVLKLTLILNDSDNEEEESGEEKKKAPFSGSVEGVKQELRLIRDRVNKLLDYLDDKSSCGPRRAAKEEEKSEAAEEEEPPMNGEQSKEFDPLQGAKAPAEEIPSEAHPKAPSEPPQQQQQSYPPQTPQNLYPQARVSKPLHTSAYPQHPSMMPMNMPLGPPRSNVPPSTPPVGGMAPTSALGPPPTGGSAPGSSNMQRVPSSASGVYPPPPMAMPQQQQGGMMPGQQQGGMMPGQQQGGMMPGQGTPGMMPGQQQGPPGMMPGQQGGMMPGQTPGGQVPGYNPYYKPGTLQSSYSVGYK